MTTVLHKSTTRGHANHGWLDSWHTFSFGTYHDPARMHFGALRVLNDDTVQGARGFGRHGHDNMEIISIPLDGELEHIDDLGNVQRIQPGDVQVMSAGTGVVHAEKNRHAHLPVRFLQLWVLPNRRNVPPRYQQQYFAPETLHNQLATLVCPMGSQPGIPIYQDAWLSRGQLSAGTRLHYTLHRPGNGVYAFLIAGDVTINDIILNQRDGLGISNTGSLELTANMQSDLLLVEVPM